MKDSIIYWLARGMVWFTSRLPLSVAFVLAETIAAVYFAFDSRRKRAYAQVKAALGDEKTMPEMRRIVFHSYLNLARTAVEVLRLPAIKKESVFETAVLEGAAHVQRSQKSGRGTLIASAHFGNWELAQLILAAHDIPISVIARPQPMNKLNDLLNELRSATGSDIILRGMGMRRAVQTLREKRTLAVLTDQSGGPQGWQLRFFGRFTSFPDGVFRLAYRTGADVLSGFSIRCSRFKHRVVIEPPCPRIEGEDEASAMERSMRYYVDCLERYIRRFPEQWLWMYKRWKYTRTKHIAVLLDEKAGHTAQSRAVAESMKRVFIEKDRIKEVEVREILLRYKSAFHKKLAYILTYLLLPWLQGRLDWVSWTLMPETEKALQTTYADVVISTGASALPMHAALSAENHAKRIVVMKPSFPYSLLHYDMALIPEHDRPSSVARAAFVDLAPNRVDRTALAETARLFRKKQALPEQGRYVACLIGGDTKGYALDTEKMDFVFRELLRVTAETNAKLLVTTSRRTPPAVEAVAKKYFSNSDRVALLVIANEQNLDDAVAGMTALAEVIVVTEDSISMVSESISSGKPVVVLKTGRTAMRPKFERFQQLIRLRNYALVVTVAEVARELTALLRKEKTLSLCRDKEHLAAQLAGTL